jgi:hypothetical protein
VTDVVATGLVAATETHMTEPKDDLLDVNHAVKIHAPPRREPREFRKSRGKGSGHAHNRPPRDLMGRDKED